MAKYELIEAIGVSYSEYTLHSTTLFKKKINKSTLVNHARSQEQQTKEKNIIRNDQLNVKYNGHVTTSSGGICPRNWRAHDQHYRVTHERPVTYFGNCL